MSDTPETDKCVKENRHIRFLEEDHCSLNGRFTYTHPIVALCRKLERKLTAVTEQRDEARETVESLTTTAFDLLSSLEKAREQRDRYKLACDKYSEDEMTNSLQSLKQERDGWKAAYDNQVKLKRIISERPDLKEREEH